VAIEYRWAEGDNDRFPSFVADLVRRRVAVIVVAGSTPAGIVAKAATQTIPIVFQIGTDPVKVGLVASLARPGGNLTGVTTFGVELIAKRLSLVRKLVPAATTIAVLINPTNSTQTETETRDVQVAARALGLRVVILRASSPSEIESAFAALVGGGAGALVVSSETFFFSHRDQLVALAASYAVPTIYAYREFTTDGGLVNYGPDLHEPYHLLGSYAGRILKGEKPADLPVEQATKLELVINLKTAKALSLTIPETLLATADEVIQ